MRTMQEILAQDGPNPERDKRESLRFVTEAFDELARNVEQNLIVDGPDTLLPVDGAATLATALVTVIEDSPFLRQSTALLKAVLQAVGDESLEMAMAAHLSIAFMTGAMWAALGGSLNVEEATGLPIVANIDRNHLAQHDIHLTVKVQPNVRSTGRAANYDADAVRRMLNDIP